MIIRTRAIVLRRIRYSDTSIIATVLTPSRGIESILAKGARSAKSRASAILQPLEEIEIQYYVKPGRDLHILRSSERTAVRHRLHSSYEHTLAGLAMIEIVLRLELPGHPADEVFAVLAQALTALDAAESNVAAFPVAFAFRFAAAHGFPLSFPPLDVHSSSEYVFAFDSGQLAPLHQSDAPGELLNFQTARALTVLATAPLESLAMFDLKPDAIDLCHHIAITFLSFHFERPLRRDRAI